MKISEITLFNFHKQKGDLYIIENKSERIILREHLTDQKYVFVYSDHLPEDPCFPYLSTPTGAIYRLSKFISKGELVLGVSRIDGEYLGKITHANLQKELFVTPKSYKTMEDCMKALKKHHLTLPDDIEINKLIKNIVIKQKRSNSSKNKKNQEIIKRNRERKINELSEKN